MEADRLDAQVPARLHDNDNWLKISDRVQRFSYDAAKIDRDVEPHHPFDVIFRSRAQTERQLRSQKLFRALLNEDIPCELAGRVSWIFSLSYNDLTEEQSALVARGMKAMFLEATGAPAIAFPAEYERYTGNRGGGSKGEDIVTFLRRVWKPWIDAGVLNRPDLRRLDPAADQAVGNWLRSKPWPEDLPLPRKSETVEWQMTLLAVSKLGRAAEAARSRARRPKR